MKKKFKNNKGLLGVGSILIIYSLMIGAAISSIPERICIPIGDNLNISYRVPLTADLDGELIGALNNSSEKVTENIHIDLSSPFSVSASKVGETKAKVSLLGIIPIKTVAVDVMDKREIVPCGNIVGVTLNTDGILVLGTGKLQNSDGEFVSPAKGIIKSGDIIELVNNTPITNREGLIKIIEESGGEELVFTILRNGKRIEANISPVKSMGDNTYKLGIWVRDSTQGLGTITFYDAASLSFGALGHGIYDVDTNILLSVKEGGITEAEITGVKKGESGEPGEVMGNLEKTNGLGAVTANTNLGLYGILNKEGEEYLRSEVYPVGMRFEVKEGEAVIRTDVIDGVMDEYTINIDSIDLYGGNTNKSMVITVTDKRLLSKTGGIIQGMSGSPIIQNNKIIGAVTHVFVQRPNRGYGIFIENMLAG